MLCSAGDCLRVMTVRNGHAALRQSRHHECGAASR
jgi:hypothetical protein